MGKAPRLYTHHSLGRRWVETWVQPWRFSRTWCFGLASTTTRSSRSGTFVCRTYGAWRTTPERRSSTSCAGGISLVPWGRPSPGTAEGVTALTPAQLRQFFQETYRPNGTILGVAGAIDWPELRDTVGRLFGDWKPRPEPAVAVRAVGPPRGHIVRETQQIQIALAYPAATVASPDFYPARATAAILGGHSSSRLFIEVREKRGLCYSVGTSYESHKNLAAMLCYAGTSTDRAQQTLDVMLGEIQRLGRDGVAPDELDTMRAGLKSAVIMAQESSRSRSGSLASDWYFLGRVRPIAEIAAELDAASPQRSYPITPPGSKPPAT